MSCVAWFVESSESGGWKPLLKTDSDKIEEAYLNDKINEPILIEGMFFIVNIGARILTYAYSEVEPAKRLIRGTWFFYDIVVGRIIPFSEAFASQIDSWFEEEKSKAQLYGVILTGFIP